MAGVEPQGLAAKGAAEVGDEQRGEDPSVNLLEARAAELLGHERAIFLPTASMANQIAINLLSRPGEELIAEELAHVVRYEAGGPAFHSGLVIKRIAGRRGLFGPEDVTPLVNDPAILHLAPTRVLSIENTSNGGGGAAVGIGPPPLNAPSSLSSPIVAALPCYTD